MLKSEKLRDPPCELSLDRRQHPVGIHDSPDRLDQEKALFPGEAFGHEPGELIEIDALFSSLFREAHDLSNVPLRDTQVLARMTGDALPLFRRERRVGVPNLEKERARGDRNGIGTGLLRTGRLREE